MTVRELIKELMVSGCDLDNHLVIVTNFDYASAHHNHSEDEECDRREPRTEFHAMVHPDHADTTLDENHLIIEFGYDK
jgi:hypothetical protein